MTVHCPTCGSRNVRPSHLQRADWVYLMILRYPVRCRYGRKRFSVSIFKIRKVRRDAHARDVRHKNDKYMPQAVDLDQDRSEDLR